MLELELLKDGFERDKVLVVVPGLDVLFAFGEFGGQGMDIGRIAIEWRGREDGDREGEGEVPFGEVVVDGDPAMTWT